MHDRGRTLSARIDKLFGAGEFSAALPLCQEATKLDPTTWTRWYQLGQCHRFLEEFPEAVHALSRAAELAPQSAAVAMALGIAQQLDSRLEHAVATLKRAIELDADLANAYNSLGVSYRKQGQFEQALEAYDAGLHALGRGLCTSLSPNTQDGTVHDEFFTRQNLWVRVAVYAATYLAARSTNVTAVAYPSAKIAEEEARTRSRGGLLWWEEPSEDGGVVRIYLPNFFNAVAQGLRPPSPYTHLMGNRALVLEELHRDEEAEASLAEAEDFGGDLCYRTTFQWVYSDLST